MGHTPDDVETAAGPAADGAAGQRPSATSSDRVAEEQARLRAVESVSLQLDDSGSARFDRVVRVAHHVFDVPIATITVLDGNDAHFFGEYGLGVRSMPQDHALCAMMLAGSAVVIHDLTQVEEFATHDAVVSLGIRFYAGYPLSDPHGHVVGALSLFDTKPRTLDDELKIALADVGEWAQQELVASAEMTQAARVQSSMLPQQAIRADGWEISGVCLPSLSVGGDFFDYELMSGVAHLGVGDVMGKGTAAALLGAGVRAAVRGTRDAVVAGVDLGISTTRVAAALFDDLERAESFVTLFQAAIELEDGWMRWLDAGSGLALIARADGSADPLSGNDLPFGVLRGDHWSEHSTVINPGDRLVVFSDGLLDLLVDPSRWWIEVAGLVREHREQETLLAAIQRRAENFTGLDDITVLAVFRHEAAS